MKLGMYVALIGTLTAPVLAPVSAQNPIGYGRNGNGSKVKFLDLGKTKCEKMELDGYEPEEVVCASNMSWMPTEIDLRSSFRYARNAEIFGRRGLSVEIYHDANGIKKYGPIRNKTALVRFWKCGEGCGDAGEDLINAFVAAFKISGKHSARQEESMREELKFLKQGSALLIYDDERDVYRAVTGKGRKRFGEKVLKTVSGKNIKGIVTDRLDF